mmetsp:Transcript_8157/g.13163  ORF Transcript_8157/g.13163 Transcript_8157/m.13163 type:complete len:324 (+) Transcript_8157:68-1039(+)
MKFCKQILAAATASNELCDASCWLDYKRLKKLVKRLPRVEVNSGGDIETDQKKVLKKSEMERSFFLMLRKELRKVSKCFQDLEYNALKKLVSFKTETSRVGEIVKQPNALHKVEALLNKCTETHMYLLMLENYAVLNYAGFAKILKKHDKNTGFKTKDRFLLSLVNSQPFVVHPWLLSSILNVENVFRDITKVGREYHVLPPVSSSNSNVMAKEPLLNSLPPELAVSTDHYKLLVKNHSQLSSQPTNWYQQAIERAEGYDSGGGLGSSSATSNSDTDAKPGGSPVRFSFAQTLDKLASIAQLLQPGQTPSNDDSPQRKRARKD